ncbi:MAG: TonB-dependent receptor domain-containing protein, partial [Vitreimonas sp.]
MAPSAWAQRAGESAVAAASDAFGVSVGDERIGLYAEDNVRGFSPITAGNRRIEGMYIDLQGPGISPRLTSGSAIRVGIAAIGYPFPAPSGVVDYRLRPSGDETVFSVVAGLHPYGGAYAEFDAQLPIASERASVAFGAGYSRAEFQDGRFAETTNAAIIARFSTETMSLTPFYSYVHNTGDSAPIMVTAGAHLPPEFEPGRFTGQSWADRLQRTHTYGALGHVDLSDAWQLRFGAFESRSTRYASFVDLFTNVARDGSARYIAISEPELPARWTSGEARLEWSHRGEAFAHQAILSSRARDKEIELGGGASADLGAAQVGEPNPAPEPDFVFQPTTLNSVTQSSLGLAYVGRWRNLAEFNIGAQSTSYDQRVMRNAGADETQAEEILYAASLAVTPLPWLAFYGGLTTGLEETAAPPASALNRDDAPPASATEQWDAGVRLTFGDTRIVAGVFETERPYFATDPANVYGNLGLRRTRGAEISIVARPLEGLRIVGGVVHYDALVEGEAVELGRAGPRPLGSTPLFARLDLDYGLAAVPGLSAQLAIAHTGDIVASTAPYADLGGEQLE